MGAHLEHAGIRREEGHYAPHLLAIDRFEKVDCRRRTPAQRALRTTRLRRLNAKPALELTAARAYAARQPACTLTSAPNLPRPASARLPIEAMKALFALFIRSVRHDVRSK